MKKIIQITDSHISKGKSYKNIATKKRLKNIVDNLAEDIAAVIFTGDLSHYGDDKSYKDIKKIIKKIAPITYILAGNHDNLINLKKHFQKKMPSFFYLGEWQIIMLNSVKENKTYGYLSDNELKKLTNILASDNAKYYLIALHHPVVSMQSSWDDNESLRNPNDLFKITAKYPKVKAIIWGHAHEAKEFQYNNIKLLSCPSSANQSVKDFNKTGYRKISLCDNGQALTSVIWM